MTARRAAGVAGALLLGVYALTMAPGVTFWDAGEFIAAGSGLGIPHPPGTPLFVALGRVSILAIGGVVGVARAMNLLSVFATAGAGALATWLIARAVRSSALGAVVGALCAGLMTSVWANATETEVYALSLLHVSLMLACAARAADADHGDRWLVLTGYLIALAPAVHLSALVGAPAAIVMASRAEGGRWHMDRVLLLTGVFVMAAGVGRVSWLLGALGATLSLSSLLSRRESRSRAIAMILLSIVASSAVFIMLVRARHDPAINQGNPATFAALVDVVARHQYDVAPLWPRRAPAWIQLATLAEYVDWQFAMTWGHGVFTTPVRVAATIGFLGLGVVGWRTLRREARSTADALATLLVCGSLGVCVYLNLRAGWSIGFGFVPKDAHEARERDYFFVLGFWAWGIFAGYGAVALARARRWRAWVGAAVVAIPLAGNWTANDRAHGIESTAARDFGTALLMSTPRNAVLFLAGDNDSYPLWYLQQAESVRTDVSLVTVALLPAAWYGPEVARRTGLRWNAEARVPGAALLHEEQAALIANAARNTGRPVAASVLIPASTRTLLGGSWQLRGLVYVAGSGRTAGSSVPGTNDPFVISSFQRHAPYRARQPDDVAPMMLSLLECPRLGFPRTGSVAARDSLESRCNFR